MARLALVVALLALLVVCTVSSAQARKSSRRLNSGYSKSGSSPSGVSPPYSSSSPSSGSSPSSSTPSSTPTVTVPPVTSTPSSPSPVSIPPVTSSPTGGYGGYGSRTGTGTPKYWGGNPGRVPKILSLLSSLAKIFGPRVLKFLGSRITMMGAIKDSSPEAMSSLAREGSASLINAYAYNDFPLSTGEVVSQFNDALSTPELAAQQAVKFQQYNEAV